MATTAAVHAAAASVPGAAAPPRSLAAPHSLAAPGLTGTAPHQRHQRHHGGVEAPALALGVTQLSPVAAQPAGGIDDDAFWQDEQALAQIDEIVRRSAEADAQRCGRSLGRSGPQRR